MKRTKKRDWKKGSLHNFFFPLYINLEWGAVRRFLDQHRPICIVICTTNRNKSNQNSVLFGFILRSPSIQFNLLKINIYLLMHFASVCHRNYRGERKHKKSTNNIIFFLSIDERQLEKVIQVEITCHALLNMTTCVLK